MAGIDSGAFGKGPGYAASRRIAGARAREYSLVSEFKYGYRNREDITNLPPGVLVVGSQNFLTNVSDRIQIRGGYTLDGQVNSTIGGIESSYDWDRHSGDQRNLRVRTDNFGLEVRYNKTSNLVAAAVASTTVNSITISGASTISQLGFYTTGSNRIIINGNTYIYTGVSGNTFTGVTTTPVGEAVGSPITQDIAITPVVTWVALKTLLSDAVNFTEFWDSTNVRGLLLFVDGSSNIYEWDGGMARIASTTPTSITISGIKTIGQLAFYTTGTNTLLINGTTYTYTGVTNGFTFNGVTGVPINEAVGSLIVQTVKTTANSAMTGLPSTFANSLISCMRNQVYVGSLVDNTFYVSKQNNYIDYTFTAPVRLVGEGVLITLDNPPVGFVVEDKDMKVTAGKDRWYTTQFTLSSDLTAENFQVVPEKTTSRQAARSQAFISKIRNDVVFISNEPAMDTLGRVLNIQGGLQTTNISDSIKLDFDEYDFTGGSVFYHRYFIYVSVPAEGIVRIYNQEKKYWEAPQILPISRFYVVDGELFGHSSQVAESFKLFDGTNDNGAPIDARAYFSYQNYGTRYAYKTQDAFYIEGYISANATLTLGITYEKDGCATTTGFDMKGNNRQFVCILPDDASFGKASWGKHPFGSSLVQTSNQSLPPKFRWEKTFAPKDFFEVQPAILCLTTDSRLEILAFGSNATSSSNIPTQIKD